LKTKNPEEIFKQKALIGGGSSLASNSLGCHEGAVRGVHLSSNDYLMVTNSFDSINIWSMDFNMG